MLGRGSPPRPTFLTEASRFFDANCLGCHDTAIYTRKDRLVRSLDSLKTRLGDCSHLAGKEFSAIEMKNIIKYLNDEFYSTRRGKISCGRSCCLQHVQLRDLFYLPRLNGQLHNVACHWSASPAPDKLHDSARAPLAR
jgi:hypothetical protein